MIKYEGTLEIEFCGRIIRIPYHMTNLAGNATIYIDDKRGHQHDFTYRASTGEWLYRRTRGPFWRSDFIRALHEQFDVARMRHRL